jgi:hypothetical protein
MGNGNEAGHQAERIDHDGKCHQCRNEEFERHEFRVAACFDGVKWGVLAAASGADKTSCKPMK